MAMGGAPDAAQSQAETPAAAPVAAAAQAQGETAHSAPPSLTEYETTYDGEVEPPPQTDPLGISGDQIEDLSVSVAPVGSELQDPHEGPEEPQFDISGLDIAPIGAEIGSASKKSEPPPPDTSGITLAD